jgi:ribosomal protein S18 acetylase RimI-like enzyme
MVTLTIATPDHVDSLVPMFNDYRRFYEQPSDSKAARCWLEANLNQNRSTVIIAETPHDQQAIGFAQLYPGLCSVDLTHFFVLYDLYILPDYRRQGVARDLVTYATRWASRKGAARIDLETAHTNTAAATLYKGLGFKAERNFQKYSLAL